MTKETQHAEPKIEPKVVVGAVLYNDKGEVLINQNPKWGDLWVIPGGHIEPGEDAETALKREIMEELGVEIADIEFLSWQEAIYPKDYSKRRHFIMFDFAARIVGGHITKSAENVAWKWIDPREALREKKLVIYTFKSIQEFLNHQENRLEDYHDKYKRALADNMNLLKQTAREKDEFRHFAQARIIEQILPVYDNLKISLQHCGEEKNSWIQGVEYVVKQFAETLKSLGVTEIETAGRPFDHQTMEAVSEEESADPKLDDTVAKELTSGYMLDGKILKAARVVVYKSK